MITSMYPRVCPNPADEEGPEAGGDEEQQPGQRKKQRKPALNSSAFWACEKGVTGDEAYTMIKEHHEEKQSKLKAALENKAKRAASKAGRQRTENELGATVWADLCTLEREVDSLLVDEIRACLAHRAVPVPKGALKPALKALLEACISSYSGDEFLGGSPRSNSDGDMSSPAPAQSVSAQFWNQRFGSDESESDSDASWNASDFM